MSDISSIKDKAKKMWSTFAAFETVTALAAPELIKFAGVHRGDRLLDVGCGTGVVALTAAQVGAKVSGSDLTPELIMRAKENSQISNLNIDFQIADVEDLPYKDDKFDFVLSQFGHMFAPRPEIALKEMLRVLKSGGVVAFSTWPPELLTGRLFTLTGKYNPSAPKDISPPVMWGEVEVIKKRLGRSVRDITFHRAEYGNPALSPAHMRVALEAYIGPIGATIKLLEPNPEKLSEFRNAMEDLLFEYFQNNTVVQSYLMTRAIKN
jgi:SAM-dependent methyltransferase